MKKLLLIPLLIILLIPIKANATDYPESPHLIRCTCYTAPQGAITASGKAVREDIVAGKREWLGYACIIYENDDGEVGDLIGYFEFCDTGGAKTLKTGKSIDVYRNTLDRCYDWIDEYGDYVFVQIIPAVG